MIYTASQFKNEVDVLEIRLGTISDLVDCIVIAEAAVDQRGRPRELVFPQHLKRFEPWMHKIRYVVVDDMPEGETHEDDVKRERWQRDALVRGMPNLKADDLVFVSDLDEIPYPESLRRALNNAMLGQRSRLPMDMFPMALNWRWRDRGCRIGSISCVVFGSDILERGVCWAALWNPQVAGLSGIHGWHLTYQGGPEHIQSKITGMMDKAEALVMPGLDPARVIELSWIEECIATGRDMFGRTYRCSDWVDVEGMPPYVQQHARRFEHMMVPRPANQDEVEASPRCDCGGSGFQGIEVTHFPYCELSKDSATIVRGEDRRGVPRAHDV